MSGKVIRTWYSKCGPREGNFGDKLTKILLEHLTGCRIECVSMKEREMCDLIGVGSILAAFSARSTGIVWTTGFMFNENRCTLANAKIVAVRGKLTLTRIAHNSDNVVLGDGGLLCDTLVNARPEKKYELGVIPHFVDQDNDVIQEMSKKTGVKLIDICAPHMDVIEDTLRCRRVLSSSLHGLVLADSLGIPNDWIQVSRNLFGGGFKFQDYYSVFGIEQKEPFDVASCASLRAILHELDGSPYVRPGIDAIKQKLLNSVRRI